jgi:hypothetical protein
MLEFDIKDSDLDKIEEWCCEGQEQGTRYSGMTYEQGMRDIIDFIRGNMTLPEIIEGELDL